MITKGEEKSEQSLSHSLEHNVAVILCWLQHGPSWQLCGVFGLFVCDGACYCASFAVYMKCYCSNLLIVATHA